MSNDMRTQFTDAIGCLMNQPPRTKPAASFPGVRNRFDDYAAAHIQFDRSHHFSGTFFHWHRYLIWAFERDLQNLCGYTGTLPYWDWGMTAQDPVNAEIFNGDPYSMGSNGDYDPHGDVVVPTIPLPDSFLSTVPNAHANITIPGATGTGGGCISFGGPFGASEINLGPTLLNGYNRVPTGLQNAYAYRPRCIIRDINPTIAKQYTSYRNITEVILNATDIGDLQGIIQSDPRYAYGTGDIGLQLGGRITVGGDPMEDQPSNPQDPMWFLQQAQIDRLWSIWQNQDPGNRTLQVADTRTMLNYPNSAETTLNDVVGSPYILEPESSPQTIRDLSSTVDGPFCYEYV